MGKQLKNYVSLTSTLLLVLCATSAHAAVGLFGSYIGVDGTWYGASQPGSNFITAFDGNDLGSYNVGDNLLLSGAELLTYKNGGSDVTNGHIFYNVHDQGVGPGSFIDVPVGWTNNTPFNDAANNPFNNPGDQKWSNITSTPDLLTGLGAGNYEVEVYLMINTSEGDIYDSRSGSNYISTFTVNSPAGIPEPAACLLALFGALTWLALGRRRR